MANLAGRILVWLFLEREYRPNDSVRVTWTNAQILVLGILTGLVLRGT